MSEAQHYRRQENTVKVVLDMKLTTRGAVSQSSCVSSSTSLLHCLNVQRCIFENHQDTCSTRWTVLAVLCTTFAEQQTSLARGQSWAIILNSLITVNAAALLLNPCYATWPRCCLRTASEQGAQRCRWGMRMETCGREAVQPAQCPPGGSSCLGPPAHPYNRPEARLSLAPTRQH